MGLLCGRRCGKSSESCIYLAACDYDAEAYTAPTRKLSEGELTLPHTVGFPPKDTHDVRIYVNYDRLFRTYTEHVMWSEQLWHFGNPCVWWGWCPSGSSKTLEYILCGVYRIKFTAE